MAIRFKGLQQQEVMIGKLLERYSQIVDAIRIYKTEDANDIRQLSKELQDNWKDFNRNERKLNLAVVGRVKAGKSTFLNTIVFGGRHILPEAFTPKTATLTKIEYAENNSLEVEYYSPEEWKEMEREAKSSEQSDSVQAAKEVTASVSSSGINVMSILKSGSTKETFASENDLMGRLNRYVGENGEITPLVKCVTLRICKEELQGISIVDTPGLNDPVISRTQKTRDFLGKCDVVFFLSPAAQFLDRNDVDLLKAQLPQKGVARLVLVCSRFDDALVDAIYDVDSLEEAIEEVKSALSEQAESIFGKQAAEYRKVGNNSIAELLSDCREPMFVSSLFHNMIGKQSCEYNDVENNAFDNLNEHDDLDYAMMEQIGNIVPVERCLAEIIEQKDAVLAQKAQNFVPLAEKNLSEYLAAFRSSTAYKLNQLESNDKEKLERQQRGVQNKIHNIQGSLEEYFGSVIMRMERVKIEVLQDLRQTIQDYSRLQTQNRTETIRHSHKISDSKWYNPLSWGDSHYEYTYEYVQHSYINLNDALENIRNFGWQATTDIENGIIANADISDLKPKLLRLIVDNLDASDDSYDPGYFRLLTEKTLNQVRIPEIHIDVRQYLNSMSWNQNRTIEDYQISDFRLKFSETMSSLLGHISQQFSNAVEQYILQLNQSKEHFSSQMLKNINDDFEEIRRAMEDRERMSKHLREYIYVLDGFVRR